MLQGQPAPAPAATRGFYAKRLAKAKAAARRATSNAAGACEPVTAAREHLLPRGILTQEAALDNRMIVKPLPGSPKRALPKMAPPTALPRVLRPRRAAPADAVRPTRAEINLGHLRHNLKTVKRAAGRSRVFGVLKADAYGHGAPAVARTLERSGIDGFCVALLEEAVELREAGIGVPILVMGGYNGQAWGEVLARRV